jgi:hypothetical protein
MTVITGLKFLTLMFFATSEMSEFSVGKDRYTYPDHESTRRMITHTLNRKITQWPSAGLGMSALGIES